MTKRHELDVQWKDWHFKGSERGVLLALRIVAIKNIMVLALISVLARYLGFPVRPW